jgi:hypothetical protein
MSTLTRRNLLSTAATGGGMLALAVGLGACAATPTTTTTGTGTVTPPTTPAGGTSLSTVVQYGQAVATGLNSIASLIGSLPGVNAATLANIVAIVNQGAAALPTIASIATAANPIQAIFSSLPSITSLLAGIPGIPPDVQTWINAAASLAQVVGPIVGVVLSLAAAPAPGAPAPAPVTQQLDPSTAYMALLSLRKH